jgi:hypothetical protein
LDGASKTLEAPFEALDSVSTYLYWDGANADAAPPAAC